MTYTRESQKSRNHVSERLVYEIELAKWCLLRTPDYCSSSEKHQWRFLSFWVIKIVKDIAMIVHILWCAFHTRHKHNSFWFWHWRALIYYMLFVLTWFWGEQWFVDTGNCFLPEHLVHYMTEDTDLFPPCSIETLCSTSLVSLTAKIRALNWSAKWSSQNAHRDFDDRVYFK